MNHIMARNIVVQYPTFLKIFTHELTCDQTNRLVRNINVPFRERFVVVKNLYWFVRIYISHTIVMLFLLRYHLMNKSCLYTIHIDIALYLDFFLCVFTLVCFLHIFFSLHVSLCYYSMFGLQWTIFTCLN